MVSPKKNKLANFSEKLKQGIEELSGFKMDNVRIHYNSAKPAQLPANNYDQREDVHLVPDQEKHLPHESWHIVQQKQGRVKATTQLNVYEVVNDDSNLENDADELAQQAFRKHQD